jgi:NAD(P)-dependent dehydrogenase (short-subunit alcohol dehydrogenase family)
MNRRIVMTTGASGIGRALGRAFAAQKAKVFVYDIDAKALSPPSPSS